MGCPAVVRKMTADEVAAVVRDAQARSLPISIGGLTLLFRPYLDGFREVKGRGDIILIS